MDLAASIRRVQPSIVQIHFHTINTPRRDTGPRKSNKSIALGTGFVVSQEGHVITANHVVETGNDLLARETAEIKDISIGFAYPNTQNMRGNFVLMPFDIIETDEVHDLALLKLKTNKIPSMFGNLPPLALAPVNLHPTRPEDGVTIGISGYPLSQTVLVTTGGYLATSWAFEVRELESPGTPIFYQQPYIADSYLADIHVNPGNSGGPVYLASDGSVIGVCVAFIKNDVKDEQSNILSYYNSGLTIVVPAQYISELLIKHGVN